MVAVRGASRRQKNIFCQLTYKQFVCFLAFKHLYKIIVIRQYKYICRYNYSVFSLHSFMEILSNYHTLISSIFSYKCAQLFAVYIQSSYVHLSSASANNLIDIDRCTHVWPRSPKRIQNKKSSAYDLKIRIQIDGMWILSDDVHRIDFCTGTIFDFFFLSSLHLWDLCAFINSLQYRIYTHNFGLVKTLALLNVEY